MGRAPCCEKVGLKKGRWTAEEDDTLTKYIQANGEGSWRSLPKNAGLLRCGKSCRLRWINYLRIDLKRGNISTREEDIIIKLHASLGNKWSLIAGQLPGRTDNEIKNYWNSHLSRKIDTFRRPNSEPLPLVVNLGTNTNASKKKGGRTSRAAMKKNKMSYTRTTNNIGKSSASMVQENGNLENKGIVVSLPSTHTLEKETLPSAMIMSWQEETEKERRNLGMLSSYQEDVGEGIFGSSEEINNSVLSNGGEEKREGRNLMLYCPTDDNQQTSELLGPHEGLESGLLSFYDINMCSDDQMPNPNRALLSSNEKGEQNKTMVSVDDQQRESGVVSYCLSKIATSEDQESRNLSSNGESSGGGGEWLSCTSTISYLEDGRIDWEWEGFVHENLWNNEQDQEQHQQEQEEMLSWLWDTDNIINGEGEIQNLGEGMESAKQEALVAWLLS